MTLRHNLIAFESQFWCSNLISILMSDSHFTTRFWGSSVKQIVKRQHEELCMGGLIFSTLYFIFHQVFFLKVVRCMARGMFLVQGDRGAVASWLVHSTLDQSVWVQALARDIVLSFRASQFTCSAFLHSTQVYKWVLAN